MLNEQLFDTSKYTTGAKKTTDRPAQKWAPPSGKQLKMFMSAKEITTEYQALDGDRHDTASNMRWSAGTYDSRAGEATNRNRRTDGVWNIRKPGIGPTTSGKDVRVTRFQRPSPASPMVVNTAETDEQLWERKYEESQLSPDDYDEARGVIPHAKYMRPGQTASTSAMGTWVPKGSSNYGTRNTARTTGGNTEVGFNGERLYERSQDGLVSGNPKRNKYERTETFQSFEPSASSPKRTTSLANYITGGGTISPIRLGQTIGSLKKPEVLGGHHRIAVHLYESPDKLLPVLHDENMRQARSYRNKEAGYGYT